MGVADFDDVPVTKLDPDTPVGVSQTVQSAYELSNPCMQSVTPDVQSPDVHL
eukprot:COSAG01_NODE_49536_length_371_cov_0.919118_1_plen_51_part_10